MKARRLAATVQVALERIYHLDHVAAVGDFLDEGSAGERETLLLREADDGALEVSLRLPVIREGRQELALDPLCQIIEGVSHFVYVIERARARRNATQLELELQAEVDKWVVLAASASVFDVEQSAALRERLYEQVAFVHEPGSELGERYRVANDVARGFVRRLERDYLRHARFEEMRKALRCFYRGGQEDKLRLGRAA